MSAQKCKATFEISKTDGNRDNDSAHNDFGQEYISVWRSDSVSLVYSKGQQLYKFW